MINTNELSSNVQIGNKCKLNLKMQIPILQKSWVQNIQNSNQNVENGNSTVS